MSNLIFTFKKASDLQLLGEPHQGQTKEWYVTYATAVLQTWMKARHQIDLPLKVLANKASWHTFLNSLDPELEPYERTLLSLMPSYLKATSNQMLGKLFSNLENLFRRGQCYAVIQFQDHHEPSNQSPVPDLTWISACVESGKPSMQKKSHQTYQFTSTLPLKLLSDPHQYQTHDWYVTYARDVLKTWMSARLHVEIPGEALSTLERWHQFLDPFKNRLSQFEYLYLRRMPEYLKSQSSCKKLGKLFTILENLLKLTNENIKVTFIAQTSATPTSVPPSFPDLSWIDKKAASSCAKQAPNTAKTTVAEPMVGPKPVATEAATGPVIPACPEPAELLLQERFAPADPAGFLERLYFLEEHCQTLMHNPYLDPRATSPLLVCIRIECEKLLDCLLGTQTTRKPLPLADRLFKQKGFPVQAELAFHGIRQICNLGAHSFLDLSQYPGAREQLLGYLYIILGWGKSMLPDPMMIPWFEKNHARITYH